MLGLLLTLFISLFSYCPIVYSIDHKENNVLENSNCDINSKYITHVNSTNYTSTWVDFCSIPYLFNVCSWFGGNSSPTVDVTTFLYGYTSLNQYNLSAEVTFDDIGSYGNSSRNSVLFVVRDMQNAYNYGVNGANIEMVKSITFRVMSAPSYPNFYNDRFVEIRTTNNNLYSISFRNYFNEHADYGNGWNAIDINYISEPIANTGLSYDSNSVYYYVWTSTQADIGPSYNEGYSNGYTAGQNEAFERGYNEGIEASGRSWQSGYDQAVQDLGGSESVALTIFTGILEVAMIPVNVFLQILNFEVFGINISGLVSGLLTIAVVVIILRFFLGSKND